MVLSDYTLSHKFQKRIEPFRAGHLSPGSYDFTLGEGFIAPDFKEDCFEIGEDILEYKEVGDNEYTLNPHEFVLATTEEYFIIPNNVTAFVYGRSSIGRLGLFIQNAGLIDAGFEGKITLELYNASNFPIKLKAGTKIGQLVYEKMDCSANKPYEGKYQVQDKVTGSKIHYENDNLDESTKLGIATSEGWHRGMGSRKHKVAPMNIF